MPDDPNETKSVDDDDPSMRKKTPPPPPRLPSTQAQQAAKGQASVAAGNTSGAPHDQIGDTAATAMANSNNKDECFCNWGADCAKFRRYFERIREILSPRL